MARVVNDGWTSMARGSTPFCCRKVRPEQLVAWPTRTGRCERIPGRTQHCRESRCHVALTPLRQMRVRCP
jgi:hypothetical protein